MITLGEVIHDLIFNEDLRKQIETECARLLATGAIDTALDEYWTSRMLITVALENVAVHYEPMSLEYKKIMDNLRKF